MKSLNDNGDMDGDMPTFGKGVKMKKTNVKLKKKISPKVKDEAVQKLKTMLMNR